MRKILFSTVLIFSLLITFGVSTRLHAESSCPEASQLDGLSQDDLRARLADCDREISALNEQINTLQKAGSSIKQDINLLATQIAKSKLLIKQKNAIIDKLTKDINQHAKTINTLSDKIDLSKDSLSQLIKKTYAIDQTGVAYLLLSQKTVSDFYRDLDSFASLKRSIKVSVDIIKSAKADTEIEKQKLEQNKDSQVDAKAQLETEKKRVEKNQAEQQKLLNINNQQQSAYQKEVADRQAKVDQIKAKLFLFAGGSTKAIPFEQALQYAEQAQNATDIDPAFLLAVLTQETKLGANVGKCYLTDTSTGAGINRGTGKTWSNLMKPSRDIGPFLDIINRLGMNWADTVVSCPIAGVAGYGGAMGPAQFIPSTWKLFETRTTAITGSANPWNARDAMMTSALYLTDLGARGISTSAQNRAACKYYGSGGSSCSYSRSVMRFKASIQSDIDYLKQYGVSRR